MPRIATLAALATAIVPASASAAGFDYGVGAGEVTPSSAILWTRAPAKGKVQLQVATDSRLRRGVAKKNLSATTGNDLTVQSKITGLDAGKEYFYGFTQGSKRSEIGQFSTAPKPSSKGTVTFAYTGDMDAQAAKGKKTPFWGKFSAYREMAQENNDFNLNFGDTIYSDTEVGATNTNGAFTPVVPPALTTKQKWAKYKLNLGQSALQELRGSGGLYSHWDDHEFINDFSVPENGRSIYNAGVQAFTDYAPVTYTPSNGLYRTFQWGKNVELFFLDERSFRSAKACSPNCTYPLTASKPAACNNPDTGLPDLAPTGPAATRNLFSVIVPSLKQPVDPACLAAIANPSRTMLGASQLQRFENDVKSSTATFKVIVNEVPIQQFYALPYDRWEGYAAERQKLISFLQNNVKNAVFLSTDVHATLVNDVRLQTLEAGGPVNSGLLEVTTGPVGTRTFAGEIDEAVGRPDSGKLVTDLFFKPPPPNGLGMQCAQTNTNSYTEVKVSSSTLTLTPKDQNGKALDACGPFTVGNSGP